MKPRKMRKYKSPPLIHRNDENDSCNSNFYWKPYMRIPYKRFGHMCRSSDKVIIYKSFGDLSLIVQYGTCMLELAQIINFQNENIMNKNYIHTQKFRRLR